MSRSTVIDNPFTALRFLKAAALSGSLRSAEKALRSAEAARRQTLEDHIQALNKEKQQLQKQVTQVSTEAAQTNAQAAAMSMQPGTPPAAQPQYGAMLGGPGAEGQDGTGQQSQAKTVSAPKLPGQPAGM